MGSVEQSNGSHVRKQILLNAFDMSTVGHLSPGQWKVRDNGTGVPEGNSRGVVYLQPPGQETNKMPIESQRQVRNKKKPRVLD